MLAATLRLYKNAYTGLNKESWLLGLVILINRSGTMVLPFLSIYCTKQLGFTLRDAGLVMAMFGAGAIVGSQLAGRLVDRIGFYKVQIIALIAGGAMFFVVVQLQSLYTLCAGVFMLSLCNESFRPANSTAIVHYSKPAQLTKSYAINRLAINLGFAVGGALGGWLAAFDYQWLFWVDGATNIMAALLMLRLLPPIAHHSKHTHATALQKSDSPFADKIYMAFIVFTFLFAVCFMQLFSMQPVFLKQGWHFSEQQIGTSMALNGLIIVCFEMVLLHSLEGKKHALYFIRIGLALLALAFGLYALPNASFGFGLLVMSVLTIGEIFTLPFLNNFWTHRTKPNNRGRYAALYTTAWSAAHVTAPTVGALLATAFGYSVLWLCITVGFVSLIYFAWLLERKAAAQKNN